MRYQVPSRLSCDASRGSRVLPSANWPVVMANSPVRLKAQMTNCSASPRRRLLQWWNYSVSDTAATLLVTAGGSPERLRSEAVVPA